MLSLSTSPSTFSNLLPPLPYRMVRTPNTISLCDEDYIDMVLSSSSSSSPQSRDFEFPMSAATPTTTSPADDLFFQGKLLPLLLPPRRLMLQTLLSDSPSESRRFSCDLNPLDHFFELNNNPKKPKKSILGMTLKASRTFLKSFTNPSSCSSKTNPFRHIDIASIKNIADKEGRRSFSGAIKRHSPAKCLSSSSSSSDSSSSSLSLYPNEPQYSLRRSSSATEIEGSIQAAIAHCKNSHYSTNTCSFTGDEETIKRPVFFST